MKPCNQYQFDIPAILDGSASEAIRSAFEDHAAACPDCAEAYRRHRIILDAVASYERPPEFADGEEAFLDRLDRALDAISATTSKPEPATGGVVIPFRWLTGRQAKITSAAAAALVAGLFIGHELFSPESFMNPYQPDGSSIASNAGQPGISAEERAEQFIGSAELVLLSMVNTNIEEEFPYRPSFDRQRSLSRDLLDQAVYIREGIEPDSPGHERLLDLMDSLEVILMQIAALDIDYTADDLAFIQSSAERKAVLFKMNLDAVLTAGKPYTAPADQMEQHTHETTQNKRFY